MRFLQSTKTSERHLASNDLIKNFVTEIYKDNGSNWYFLPIRNSILSWVIDANNRAYQ